MTTPYPSVSGVSFNSLPDYPGYCIGDNGTVWTCRGSGPAYKTFKPEWRQLSPKVDHKGRRSVTLVDTQGRRCVLAVARLVLSAFVGSCPDGMEACHFPDRDPGNNRLTNLRWDTRKNNFADRDTHGTTARGERVPTAKLTAADVTEIRRRIAAGEPRGRVGADYGIGKTHMSRIVRRMSWAHIPTGA
jgi:hypothetical protein